MFGYSGLNYSKDFISKIVEEAYEMKTGARGLQTVMLGIQNKLLIDMLTNKENNELTLNEEVIEEYKKAKVIKF
jgi:ATP-dependent protease Clp ATPase subunit